MQLVARAQGGLTLGLEQGELGADFPNLGVFVSRLLHLSEGNTYAAITVGIIILSKRINISVSISQRRSQK
jgi:hypothetical protein